MAAESKQQEITRVVITGANRGVGFEFVKQFLQRDGYQIVALCRTPDKCQDLIKLKEDNKDRIIIEKLESTNDKDIENIATTLKDKPIDILILNAAIYGEKDAKTNNWRQLGNLERSDFLNVYNVNVVGPILLGQALYDNIKSSTRKQIIGITSGGGSISDCTSNMAVPYRCSKTALNMAFQSFKYKSESEKDGLHALLINPGLVSKLGVTESIKNMLDNVIDKYKEKNNGGFYNYDGKVFPW